MQCRGESCQNKGTLAQFYTRIASMCVEDFFSFLFFLEMSTVPLFPQWSHAGSAIVFMCTCWLPLVCWPYGESSMPMRCMRGQASRGADERLLSVAIWEAARLPAFTLLSSQNAPIITSALHSTTPSLQNPLALREGLFVVRG